MDNNLTSHIWGNLQNAYNTVTSPAYWTPDAIVNRMATGLQNAIHDPSGLIGGGLGGVISKVGQGALDMSLAARAARAAEQGFTSPTLYHGTTGDITAFNPKFRGSTTNQANAKIADFFATNPDVASQYAAYAEPRDMVTWNRLIAQGSKATTPGEKAFYDQRIAGLQDQALKASYDANQSFNAGSPNVQGANVLPVKTNINNPYIHNANGTDMSDADVANILATAKSAGHDGVIFKNMVDTPFPYDGPQGDIYAVFNPKNIRSVNAAYDPANINSPNILAGMLALTPGQQQLQQNPFSKFFAGFTPQ